MSGWKISFESAGNGARIKLVVRLILAILALVAMLNSPLKACAEMLAAPHGCCKKQPAKPMKCCELSKGQVSEAAAVLTSPDLSTAPVGRAKAPLPVVSQSFQIAALGTEPARDIVLQSHCFRL